MACRSGSLNKNRQHKPQPQNHRIMKPTKKRALIPHIRNCIKGSNLAQLKKMKKELSFEIKNGILKDRPEHSYTLELEFIEKQITLIKH